MATSARAAGGLVGWSLNPGPEPSRPVTRFRITLPATQRLTPASRLGLALSPDGSMLVYVANNQLYLRFMDRQDPQPLRGTENAKSPFFSPDGQWVGFVGGPNTNQLKRVAIGMVGRRLPSATCLETSSARTGNETIRFFTATSEAFGKCLSQAVHRSD